MEAVIQYLCHPRSLGSNKYHIAAWSHSPDSGPNSGSFQSAVEWYTPRTLVKWEQSQPEVLPLEKDSVACWVRTCHKHTFLFLLCSFLRDCDGIQQAHVSDGLVNYFLPSIICITSHGLHVSKTTIAPTINGWKQPIFCLQLLIEVIFAYFRGGLMRSN